MDATWTVGVGRSHFAHRAGVVFRDTKSLRDGLTLCFEGRFAGEAAGIAAGLSFPTPASLD